MKNCCENIARLSWWIVILLLIFHFTQTSAECNDDQFQCNSNECIDLSFKCDGIKDCVNGKDEEICPCDNEYTFKCNNGTCISNALKCDKHLDCLEGEDENPEDCVKPTTTEEPTTTTIEETINTTEERTTTEEPTTEKSTTEEATTILSTAEVVNTTTNEPNKTTTEEETTVTSTEVPTTEILTTEESTTTAIEETTTTTSEEPTITTTATEEPTTTTLTTTEEATTTMTTTEKATTTTTTTTTTEKPTTMKMTTTTKRPTTTTKKRKTTTKPTKKKPTKEPTKKTTKKTTKKPTTTTKKPVTTTKATLTITSIKAPKPTTTTPIITTMTTSPMTTTVKQLPISYCDVRGTILQHPYADGRCECKAHVIGDLCDQCSSHSFFLDSKWNTGCIRCFCNGVSQTCTSSSLFRDTTRATFEPNRHQFALITDFEYPQQSHLEVEAFNNEVLIRNLASDSDVYFWRLPSQFAGNKITSYGGNLNYTIRYVPTPGGIMSRNNAPDVVIRSLNDITILHYRRDEVAPSVSQSYLVPILEENWQRIDGNTINREHLLMTLADVSDIFIKATYTTSTDEAALSSVILDTASQHYSGNPARASEVEQCTCPAGHQGTSCEDCAPGYKRSQDGIYLGLCEPCDCNGHSDECDAENGVCNNCRDNTEGDHCEVSKPKPKQHRTYEEPLIEIQLHAPQIVRVGGSIMLTCRILAGIPTPTVVWGRRDRKPLSQRVKEMYNGSNLISIDYYIPSLTLEDAGDYECFASNAIGSAKSTAAIHVLQPPIAHILPNSAELTITEGHELKLECFAEGFPLPIVQWERSDRFKKETNHKDNNFTKMNSMAQSLIRKFKADRRDEGIYMCHAKNDAGEDQKSIIVRVEARRNEAIAEHANLADNLSIADNKAGSKHPPKKYNVTEGYTTEMACEITIKDKPIIWIRSDGQPLPSNHKIVGRDLIIYNTQKMDAGIYECVIHELKTQNAMFTTELTVLDHTDRDPVRYVRKGGSISLECDKRTSPYDRFNWRREGGVLPRKVRFGPNNRLILSKIRSGDAGRYICRKIDSNGQETVNYYDVRVDREIMRRWP